MKPWSPICKRCGRGRECVKHWSSPRCEAMFNSIMLSEFQMDSNREWETRMAQLGMMFPDWKKKEVD